MTNTLLGLEDKIRRSIDELAYTKVSQLASSIQSGLLYEFQNDLVFAGHSKEFGSLSNVSVDVIKVSDREYKLSMDMSGLNEKQKELFEFYFKNAKARALGGGA